MPWKLEKANDGYYVVNAETGKRRSKRALPKKRAQAQMRALYANVPEASKEIAIKGGKGSGHFGHRGRPGQQGGSAPSGMTTRRVPVTGQSVYEVWDDLYGTGRGGDPDTRAAIEEYVNRNPKFSALEPSEVARRFQEYVFQSRVDTIGKGEYLLGDRAANIRMLKKLNYHDLWTKLQQVDKTYREVVAVITHGNVDFNWDALPPDQERLLSKLRQARQDIGEAIDWNRAHQRYQTEPRRRNRARSYRETGPMSATKEFDGQSGILVFKEKSGKYRWVAVSSTAFRDRDGEIVSTKALLDDVARADRDGDYGPLRWWHVPGLDIGDCDYNAVFGRTLVESGTFRNNRIARAVQKEAQNLRISIGFLHPAAEPDRSGVFSTIRRFERSVLPRDAASNPLTAILVKGD